MQTKLPWVAWLGMVLPMAILIAMPARADGDSYRVALSHGRKLLDGGNYLKAIAAFEQALTAQPGDSIALSELAWAAFLAGNLANAEKAAAQVTERAKEKGEVSSDVLASTLYTVGRIHESRGARD